MCNFIVKLITIHARSIPQRYSISPSKSLSGGGGERDGWKANVFPVRGLLVRGTCRRRVGRKNTTIWEGTMSAVAEVGTCCSARVADWQRKMSATRIDDHGPRIDFCFDLIIVTPGKRPPPVISPPSFCLSHNWDLPCPTWNVCATYSLVESRTSNRGLLRYYIYDAISLRDVNDNWVSAVEEDGNIYHEQWKFLFVAWTARK